jgi:inositol phosphorylceramide synthase regulatory subunit
MSLSTGATLITLSLLMNKLSGLYGILALLTGYELSPLQLSMYIYSLCALVLTAYLSQHIKSQSPLQCLALAWFYVLDSIVNAAYTTVFAMTWFLVLMQHNAGQTNKKGPGAGTVDDTAGFTSPEQNVSSVQVTPNAPSSDQLTEGVPSDTAAGANGSGSLQQVVLSTESMNSIGIIIALWTIRAYFCIIMLGWARMVIRQHISNASTKSTNYTSASADARFAENPFDASKPEGQGWPGAVGRFLISIGRTYWLGKDTDDSWMYSMKFRKSTGDGNAVALKNIEAGPAERERRRRSGTGPPLPAPDVVGDGKTLQVPTQNL